MPLYTAPVERLPAAGQYMLTTSQNSSTTSNAAEGLLRVAPWVLRRPVAIDRIGAVVTTVGEANSKVRLGVYADTGNAYPGALLLDAGQINGDSATTQEITVALTLAPGIYWIGGVSQACATTPPTVRIAAAAWVPPLTLSIGTSVAAGAATMGYQQTGVTGALPSTFSATVTATTTPPRVFVRVA